MVPDMFKSVGQLRPPAAPHMQQHAVRMALFLVGYAFSTWATLIPFAKRRAGLDEGSLGLLLVSFGVGCVAVMPFAAPLAAKYSCRAVVRCSAAVACLVLPLLAWFDHPLLLAGCLFGLGGSMGVTEVVANIQGVHVQREAGRPLMSGFHAFYSIGSILGAGFMTLLFSLSLSPFKSALIAICLIVLVVTVFSSGLFGHDPAKKAEKQKFFVLPKGIVLWLGIFLLIMFMAEGSVANWSALFLVDFKEFSHEYGALGLAIFSISIAAGRLVGDKAAERVGSAEKMIAYASISTAVCYFLTIHVFPGYFALIGYGLIGLSMATLVPSLFTLTGKQKMMNEDLAISSVTAFGYGSALLSSPLIGMVARYTSLSFSLSMICVILLGMALCVKILFKI